METETTEAQGRAIMFTYSDDERGDTFTVQRFDTATVKIERHDDGSVFVTEPIVIRLLECLSVDLADAEIDDTRAAHEREATEGRERVRYKDAYMLAAAGDTLLSEIEDGGASLAAIEAFRKALRDARQTFNVASANVDLSSINVGAFGGSAIPVPKVVREGGKVASRSTPRPEEELHREAFAVAAHEDTNTAAFGSSPVPPVDPQKVIDAYAEDAAPTNEAPAPKTHRRWSEKLREGAPGNEFRIADLRVDVVAAAKGLLVFVEKSDSAIATSIREGIDKSGDLLVELVIALLEHINQLEGTEQSEATVDTMDALMVLQERIFQTAVAKGWWPDMPLGMDSAARAQFVLSKLALIHSEVSEALELARDDNYETFFDAEKASKPEGFGTEIADVVIRCMDLCAALGIDLGELIVKKVEFNEGRQHRHGGRLA